MDTSNNIKVWDIFVRVFHWSLLILFIFSYFSGEEESDWHIWSGYAIVALVLARVLWGFIGSKHARFSDFIYSPAEMVDYAKGLMTGGAKRYFGHNPLGGAMILALLLSLGASTLSGMMLYGVEEGEGPFGGMKGAQVEMSVPSVNLISTAYADDDDDDRYGHGEDEGDEFMEEVHEFFVNLTILLAMIHVAGVAFESVYHRESLVKAMIDGYKRK